MASILRLAAKDRSSFLFKKSGQQNTSLPGPEAYDPDSDQLPSISHVDTASLLNLFDRYKSLEQSPVDNGKSISQLVQGSTSARDFAWPVSDCMRSTPNLNYTMSPTNMAAPITSNGDEIMANVARNDSTGSSSLSRNSDTTPPMTRQSSSSSVSPLASEKSNHTPRGLTVLSQVSKSESALGSPFRPKRQRRSRTWDSTNSSSSQPPNLDKPLPLGPPGQNSRASKSSSRPKHRSVGSAGHATALCRADEEVQTPTRFESLRKHSRSTSVTFLLSNGQSVVELPNASPGTSRGVRLGRAIAQGHSPHQRLKSEDLLQSVRGTPTKPHRASAPVNLPKGSQNRQSLPKRHSKPISANTAEHVIYRIMCQVESPQDLQSLAMVSKGFLNTYQRNESKLVSNMIFKSSRPAWELRRSIITLKGSRAFKLRDYERDLRTIQALKAFILDSCRASCKAKTVAGLLGQDIQCQREVDNALWRIWTFCALFGDNASQTPIPTAELDWLNGSNGTKSRALGAGFAVGNGMGLTVDELEDISELWCCLQALISQFHGREAEAQRAGVFENWHLNDIQTSHQHIVEWTSFLLTLGPQVILSLSSGSFDHARILGLTRWTLPPQGQSRNGFLMAAISQVYQERLLAEATVKAAQITLPSGPRHRPSKSAPATPQMPSSPPPPPPVRQPSLRIDTQVYQPKRRPTSTSAVASTAPAMQIRPDCDPANEIPISSPPRPTHTRSVSASATSTLFPASPTADPTIYHSLNLTAPANTASVKLGATLFPMDYTPTTPRVPFLSPPPPPSRAPPPIPGAAIIDPIDKAMDLLVKELGFKEANAKRALAMCDSGSGINVERAIELLMLESRREAMATAAPVELPTPTDIVSPLAASRSSRGGTVRTARTKSKREYCDGGCKRPTTGSGASFATTRASVISHSLSQTKHVSTDNRRQLRSPDEGDEEADGNISPITDIYGGHSDDELQSTHTVLDDDSSEMWRRKEGNDTISPLMSATTSFRAPSTNMHRMNTQSKKAWKVLGVQERHQMGQAISVGDALKGDGRGGLKGGLSRMRSKSSSTVVGMDEYAERVERRKSMRMVQAAMSERRSGYGVVSVGVGETLKGLGLVGPREREMSGGLGGFREVQVQSEGEGVGRSETRGKWAVKGMGIGMGKKRSVRGDECVPDSP